MIDISSFTKTGAWKVGEEREGIFVLEFDLPGEKVNKLSAAVMEDLELVLSKLAGESEVKALIVSGGKEASGTFIAGADIHEIRAVSDAFDAREKARRGQQILGKFASFPAVTVAAIHGACLGGGTELALACDLRIASHSSKTRIGLPEVQLGILPGFGGTQRLPRLVGITQALPVILRGKPLDVHGAFKIGLLDEVAYPGLLREKAIALAQKALRGGGKKYRPRRRQRPLLLRAFERLSWGRGLIRRQARKSIEKQTGSHYPAPFKALDSVIDGYGRRLEDGLLLEARLVGELIASPVSKNLIGLFLTSEEVRRGKSDSKEAEGGNAAPPGPGQDVTCGRHGRVGLLGAGVMGGGIAALLARKGFRVRMKDISSEALQAGLKKVSELYSARKKRRRMTRREAANAMAAISVTTDSSGFETVTGVIEAVVENMEVKKKVFAEIEGRVAPGALLASNTSALSITEIQSGLEHPERVVGLHFFNPVDRMPLVEIIRGRQTSEGTLSAAERLARELGKLPVRVEDAPGFLVNRLLAPYLNEAVRLFEEGYSPMSVDRALRSFGMPMGPFELLDEVGLDVAAKVGQTMHEAFGDRAHPPETTQKLQDAKLLGKKSGKGFYLHRLRRSAWKRFFPFLHSGGLQPNPEALRFGATGGRNFLPDNDELWVKRLIYPIINEAARALDEKVVASPALLDLAMVTGTGFAPFRGGPLRYADSVGIEGIVDFLAGTEESRLQPSELLSRLQRENLKFYVLHTLLVAAEGQ